MESAFRRLKILVHCVLLIIFGIQCFLSLSNLIQGGNNLIDLTFIESENNQDYHHPLYTVNVTNNSIKYSN